MIKLKTKEDIETMKVGGAHHAEVLRKLAEFVEVGVTAKQLNDYAESLIETMGDKPAFKGYKPEGVSYPYPSVNDEIVHGIPHDEIILEEGDVVSLDVGLVHENLITDSAITVIVGKGTKKTEKLLNVTKESLMAGIKQAKVGNTVGHIGAAIQKVGEEHGYGIVRVLAGHGVGYEVHEDPYVPNYGVAGEGEKLVAGMVIAIEPMFTLGSHEVAVCDDEYTYVTRDKSLAAHFEHTVAITDDGPIILTME
jgi:methionyl aminopeptidase